jgi:predicted GNAT family N-acyltransferase
MSRSQPPEFSSAPSLVPSTPIEFEIRELGTIDELISSYRLRYQVYAALGYLQQPNKSKLEVDPFDQWAIPFGAFDPASGAMIGTVRLITRQPQCHFSRLVRRVLELAEDDLLAEHAQRQRPHNLPSIVSDTIEGALAAFNSDRLPVSELSRCIVVNDFRGTGVSRKLMEYGIAHAAFGGAALLVGSFLPSHLPMYARYGYVQLPQTGFDLFDSVDQIAISAVCRTDRLPKPTRSHVGELLRIIGAETSAVLSAQARGARLDQSFSQVPDISLA